MHFANYAAEDLSFPLPTPWNEQLVALRSGALSKAATAKAILRIVLVSFELLLAPSPPPPQCHTHETAVYRGVSMTRRPGYRFNIL